MKKWILILLLLLAAFWAGGKFGEAQATAHAEALADSAATQTALAVRTQQSVDSLRALEAVLRASYQTDTLWRTRTRTAWDTLWLPGVRDTVSVATIRRACTLSLTADSVVIAACEARVAVATERADSAQATADNWQAVAETKGKEATTWRRVAKGPLLRLAVEGTWSPTDDWQAAGDVTVGRGHLKALARVDVGPGAESCAFQPSVEAYACTTATDVTLRFGARYTF